MSRKGFDPWVGQLYKFMLQHPVGVYSNVSLADRVIPNLTWAKSSGKYEAEVKLGEASRMKVTFTEQGKVENYEHLNY